jgi:3-dehydroquinate dehydratase/shikimate dehydrogenase
MVNIVETVTGHTMAELCAARDAVRDADLIELRLDGVADLDVGRALDGRPRPVIVTCRPCWEGGRFDGSETDRLAILSAAVHAGAECVDVEWRAAWTTVPRTAGTSILLSHHDFDGVPADLAARVRAMRAAHDGLIKVSVTANRLRDCLALRDAVRADRPVDQKCIAIAMGTPGQITRVWPSGFGSPWTYGGSAAPGQLPAGDLARRYRVRETSSGTALYGVAGRPLAHSASPAMHNAAFAAAGLDAVYLPFETDDPDDVIAVADALGVVGLSVTAPLKTALATRVASASDAVRGIGAVNTLRRTAHGWEGENFDAAAFLEPLAPHADALGGQRAVVLGAGGAARAVAWALQRRGVRVAIAARRTSEAARLAGDLGADVASWPPSDGWTLLVNATPVGTWPDVEASPVAASDLSGAIVYDLVYNPPETALLAAAWAAGAETIGGLPMLVDQARRQLQWWTGRDVPAAWLEAAARRHLAQPDRDARREARSRSSTEDI